MCQIRPQGPQLENYIHSGNPKEKRAQGDSEYDKGERCERDI